MKTYTVITVLCAVVLLSNIESKAVTNITEQLIGFPTNGYYGDIKLHLYGGPEDETRGFIHSFERGLNNRAWSIANNRLGKANYFDETRSILHNKDMVEYYNDRGQGVFNTIFDASLREMISYELPLRQWEDASSSYLKRFAAMLLRDSIGNTEEEDLRHVSPVSQAETMDPSWWENIGKKGIRGYGVRVIRKNPYAYISFGLGHVNHRPVIVDLRMYSMVFERDTGSPKMRASTIIPLTERSHINIGGEFYPTKVYTEEGRLRASVRYERAIFGKNWNTFYSLGAETRANENMLVAMINKSF